MLNQFAYIVSFLVVGAAFVGVTLLVAQFISPHKPSKEKSAIYDCGENPVGVGLIQFNMRFYLVALVFVIFDVEIAFMYPVTAIFKEMLFDGWGMLALVEIGIFVVILLAGFVYAWSEGGLNWVRNAKQLNQPGPKE